jgi:hypothetical protein
LKAPAPSRPSSIPTIPTGSTSHVRFNTSRAGADGKPAARRRRTM